MIAYHAVAPCPEEADPGNLYMPVERFDEQMAYLARRRTVVPLEAVVRGTAPHGSLAITFDDGFRSVLSNAVPILRRYGFPATVFVAAKWLGQRSTAWYEAPGCDADLMSEDELLEAERQGVQIESHGHVHLDLGRATPAEAEADLAASVERLSEVLGRPPRFLAYPYGRYSEGARQAAAARFEAAFTIDKPHDGLHAFERVQITRLDGRLVFALKTSGHYMRLRRSSVGSRGYAALKPLITRSRRAKS